MLATNHSAAVLVGNAADRPAAGERAGDVVEHHRQRVADVDLVKIGKEALRERVFKPPQGGNSAFCLLNTVGAVALVPQ